jgi:hypothetical protein
MSATRFRDFWRRTARLAIRTRAAAAKAACRINGVGEARVYRSRTFLLLERASGKPIWMRFHVPIRLRAEIVSFDRGGSFEPGD